MRVTDDDGLTHETPQFSISVAEPNLPPVMVGDQNFSMVENTSLQLTLNGATDPEEDTLTYSMVVGPTSGALSGCLGIDESAGLQCSFTPVAEFVGSVVFSYRANDGNRDSEMVSVVTIDVLSSNQSPVANAGSDLTAKTKELFTLDGSASSDLEGDSITFLWELFVKPEGSHAQLANIRSATPGLIADKAGSYTARLIVNDGESDSLPDEVVITVTEESNQAPSLAAITSPQTLQLGTELRLTLAGTDADSGDRLRFSATEMPANARLDSGSGQFRFRPLSDQVGTHVVNFMVSDGKQSSSLEVSFVVTPAVEEQVTALKSRVLDASAFSQGNTVPLEGVTITIEGSSVSTTSDADGYFTLSGIPHGIQIVSLNASGVAASDGSTFADFKGRLPIMPNVLNRPFRDYLLPKIDPQGMAMVNSETETTVNNTNIGVSLTIPPETAINQDGTSYTGPLSVSVVPSNATPRELPEAFRPSFIITLQPVGVRFSTPVDITFPNSDNLPAGSYTDVYSLSERGGFERVGIGKVTSNRRSIKLVAGGIRATTWHFVMPPTPNFVGVSTPNGGPDNSNNGQADECDNIGSGICAATGMLTEAHLFPSFRDSGTVVRHELHYTNTPSLMNTVVIPRFKYENQAIFDGVQISASFSFPRLMALSLQFNGVQTPRSYFSVRATQGDSGRNDPLCSRTKN